MLVCAYFIIYFGKLMFRLPLVIIGANLKCNKPIGYNPLCIVTDALNMQTSKSVFFLVCNQKRWFIFSRGTTMGVT